MKELIAATLILFAIFAMLIAAAFFTATGNKAIDQLQRAAASVHRRTGESPAPKIIAAIDALYRLAKGTK